MRAKKTYKKGGKVVAQGADKKDVRREKKMERKVARADKSESKKTQRRYKRLIKKVNRFVKDGQERNTIG